MATQVSLLSGAVASAGSLKLQTNGTTDAVTIDTAQNMGLGITPSAWNTYTALQVQGMSISAYTNGDTRLSSNAYYASGWKYIASRPAVQYLQDSANGIHAWNIAATGTAGNAITFTQAMTLDASGNLGVGTTSPTGAIAAGYTSRFTAYAAGGNAAINIKDPNGDWFLGTTSANLTFYSNTAGAERARIDSSGNLLVGTTSVNGVGITLNSGNYVYVATTSAASAYFDRRTTTGDAVELRYGGTKVGSISVTGSNTAYNTSSDYRLKENVAPMTGALNIVSQLKPCTYTWKSDGSAGQGFIAHELQSVVPDAVHGEKDGVKEDGSPVYQGIDTSFLVATLTAAIQEQQAIIQQLQADVAALKG